MTLYFTLLKNLRNINHNCGNLDKELKKCDEKF